MASLLLRNLSRQALASKSSGILFIKSCGPMSTIQAYKQMEEFWKKNRQLDRPLSPHLSVYKPELPMLTSLAHRVTGVTMALTVSGASIFFLLAPGDFPQYVELVKSLELHPAIIIAAKYVLSLPLTWHYINGIRHLSWDWAIGFDLPQLYKSGYAAVVLTLIVASTFVFLF